MPEEINLSSFRGSGLSPDETEWQDDEAIPDVNQNVISNIENMGFSRNAALYVLTHPILYLIVTLFSVLISFSLHFQTGNTCLWVDRPS